MSERVSQGEIWAKSYRDNWSQVREPYYLYPFRKSVRDFIIVASFPVGAAMAAFGGILTPPNNQLAKAGGILVIASLVGMLKSK